MRRDYLNYFYCFVLVVLPGPLLAGNFDGSKPLLCAVTEVMECWPGAGCENVRLQDINQPRFVRIDFEKQTIKGTLASGKGNLSSPIDISLKFENGLMLQGIDGPHGWSATVLADSGQMIMAITAAELSFTMFGACVPQ